MRIISIGKVTVWDDKNRTEQNKTHDLTAQLHNINCLLV